MSLLALFRQVQNSNDISQMPNWRIGLSCAASWTWGVSIAVAIAIFNTMGAIPFLIWVTGNVLALPLFGLVRKFLPSSRHWPKFVPFLLLFIVVEFFAVILNLQAIRSVLGGDLDIPTYQFLAAEPATAIVIGLGLLIIMVINRWGLRASVITDVGQYIIQILAAIALAITCIYFTEGSEIVLWTEAGRVWWPIAFLGIITGALGTGHQWQRFANVAEDKQLTVALYGGLFFAIYMLMVCIVAVYFVGNIFTGILFLILITTIASSTIDSAMSGLQYLTQRFGLTVYAGTLIGVLAVICWPMIVQHGLTAIWTTMAQIRFPMVLFLLGVTIIAQLCLDTAQRAWATKWLRKIRLFSKRES